MDSVVAGSPLPLAAVAAVAALSDESRRRLHDFVRRAGRPVSREEAAASAGISRKLAAFHLDKLVEVGLLRARFEPVGGIRKVGRTPKVYEPAEVDVRITIPGRHHDLLAAILLDAVLAEGREGTTVREAALAAAHRRGVALGAAERERLRPGRLGAERALGLAAGVLAEYGFEPHRDGPSQLSLRNCPFQPLAGDAPQLVCAINHALLSGLLEGLEATTVTAELVPRPGCCCVEFTAN
ncbi:helix-turn-helix transcriptional regulator [Pseudonocardia asaccharolytica]|uniref:ArsR family transcriptional regulator n=1 Tax=Pseudonocardia asaccharolytica DSM 44247 = NBRC 16224 TaxID=1123024 RepID=A0A511CZ48_9PSEU|nr:transcriptional regulator [Pseudonocardia asaccharolytica]GEL17819.1 ArsR family transcriptional regulator [Pseudonocardia asaccharolytica DSM 44247 = NBRC 16224]